MMDKLLHLMQSKLGKLERQELESISQESQDEAVRISLLLASQPAPPMPHFYMDSKYTDPEKLADAIDDKFEHFESKDDDKQGSSKSSKYDDYKASSISDADALKECEDWKAMYSVVVGVSWGNLPQDLQQKWMQYSCDYHLGSGRGSNEKKSSSSEAKPMLVTKEEYGSELGGGLDAKDSLDDILA